MPKELNENTRAWIEKRYGSIKIHRVTLYMAQVPVMGGIADGQGFSENDAIESLYQDLTTIENPLIDHEPEPGETVALNIASSW